MRVVLCGYYGKGNAGDEALLATLLQMLPPVVCPIVLSGNPAQTTASYGIEAYDRFSLLGISQAFKGAEGFVWGGGSLMQDTSSWVSPLYYAALMAYAQWRGLRTVAWAQGIGPLTRSWTRALTRRVLKKCDAVSVRDRASSEWLDRADILHSLAPDPVWAMQATATEIALSALQVPRIAVNLREHALLTPDRLAVIGDALITVQQRLAATIVLVPFQASLDLQIARILRDRLSSPTHLVELEDPRAMKGVFQQVDFTIAMRLHGVIMAASEGCPCFALSYDPKVTQLMTALDIPGIELADFSIEAQNLAQIWLDLLQTLRPLSTTDRSRLAAAAQEHQTILQQGLGISI